ncbi:ATP-binding protein [soil metagenome]
MGGPMDPTTPPAPGPVPPPVPFSARRRFHGWIDRAPGPPWRSADDRVLTGLAGGIGEWLGVSSTVVRAVLAFVLVGSGFGIMAYVAAAVVLPVSDRSVPPDARPLRVPRGPDLERSLVALAVALGVAFLLRVVGIWVGSDLGFPAAVAAAGLSLVWGRTDAERRQVWRSRMVRLPGDRSPDPVDQARRNRSTVVRVVAGTVLFVVGGSWVLQVAKPETVVPVVAAMAATTLGLGLLGGPWVAGLWRDLGEERRQRIRTQERAEVAAQIHDSVLQTLALIQRDPETPKRVAHLARQQERSLRRWLFADGPPADPSTVGDGALELADLPAPPTFGARLRQAAEAVEDATGAAVELVVVGDAAADARSDALVAAAREAMVNGAVHSGADAVSVFAEAGEQSISVFVRDRGRGFDQALVPADRQGLRESVVGRLARVGGRATVVSTPGEGTEVSLELSR